MNQNNQLASKVEAITQKVQTVLDEHNQLEKEYLQLLEERNILMKKVEDQQEGIKALEEKINYLKLSKGAILSSQDNSQVKVTINEFIREIDKCIAMLNN